ncbi:hypothetical protein RND81_08G026900 [Saponaria officinalis]|uniref:Protein BIG GRAIN 1-like B n=1 Tax=Saponaria officinalis TaxID=3572 RepID=A0AAW1J349_SAPOF
MSTYENNITTPTTTMTIPFHNNVTHKRRAKTPSFSSILLDAIYRSIDDTYTDTDSSSSQHNHTPKTVSTTTTTTDNNNDVMYDHDHDDNARGHGYVQSSKHRRTKVRSHSHLETMELRHAIMIDSLIEQQPPPPPQPQPQQQQTCSNKNNNTSNNNSNHGCYRKIRNNTDDSNMKFTRQKSVPSRSSNIPSSSSTSSTLSCFTQSKNRTDMTPKREASSRIFNKTKLKALKIYSDLKKSKQHQHHQPISPGARIAAFLNSIFRNSAGTTPRRPPINLSPTAACSSTPCLTAKSKRSVKYNHITDEYDDENLIITPKIVSDDHQQQQQQQQRKWRREKEIDALMTTMKRNRSNNDYRYKEVLKIEMNSDEEMMNVEDEDEDDGESCASSSDLFELENFSSIGVSRFNQELPVYGTTKLKNLIS